MHAKVIFFETESSNYILSGSANFTDSALTTSNNVELGILVKTDIHFSEIVSPIGKYEEITLDKIKALIIATTRPEIKTPVCIVETVLKGNKIIVTFETIDNLSDFSLLINDQIYNFPWTIKGNNLIFIIDDTILDLFTRSAAINVVGKLGTEDFVSNHRILRNKAIFPDEFMVFNSAEFTDPNWLFKILSQLSNLPNNNSYFNILKEMDKRGMFEGKGKPDEVFNLPFKIEPYNPKEKQKDLIEHFITRHQNRIKNSLQHFDQRIANILPFFDITPFDYKQIKGNMGKTHIITIKSA